jgi:hypothetical protein
MEGFVRKMIQTAGFGSFDGAFCMKNDTNRRIRQLRWRVLYEKGYKPPDSAVSMERFMRKMI